MQSALDIILENIKWSKTRKKRITATLLALSLVVTLNVFWLLRQPGLTLAGDASCGIVEHTHDKDCGTRICICTIPEEPHHHDDSCYTTNLIEEQELLQLVCDITEEPHTHDDSCFETVTKYSEDIILICDNQDEEHSHEDSCYETVITDSWEETELICDLVSEPHEHDETCYDINVVEAHEEQVLTCELSEEGHKHDDECYEWQLTCEQEEHVHSIDCYSDDTADAETLLDWQEMFEDYPYSGNLREDLVGIAKTQVGYSESERNFEVGDDGIRRGYTRYGAWYGTPYRDWSAMFVSFCLSYAGADPEETPGNSGASAMATLWEKLDKLAAPEDYIPLSGDLVFFNDNTVGIVSEIHNTTFHVIRGDYNDEVCVELLTLTDESISGWGLTVGTLDNTEELPEPTEELPDSEETTEATEKTPKPSEDTLTDITKNDEAEQESEVEESEVESDEVEEDLSSDNDEIIQQDLFDVSKGPAFFIFSKVQALPKMQRYSLRKTQTVIDLLPYLEANGGSYFFTLMDFNNTELPKDENGNYIAVANKDYKLAITFNSPEGFHMGTYQHQIPNGLMVDGGEGSFILNSGTEYEVNVGSWTVTDTGLITLTFNEHMDSHSEITISATMGIHFPEQEDPIDFDGKIIVTVEPPPQQQNPTILQKWGQPDADEKKLDWVVLIYGNADSQITGSIITDQVGLPDWGKPHSYTQSDMDAGLTFGVTDANGGWHNWTVTPDDPRLIWDENGWSYKIPETVICDYCGELELGNSGWMYQINYSSTPTPLNTPGNFAYENKVTVDGQTAWGWNYFIHGQVEAQIIKNGSFVSDAAGGGFLWEVQASIPGRPEGQKAEYSWAISDEMRLLDQNGVTISRLPNDIHLATVTATYNGTTIQIPRIQDATDEDMFAWDNAWTSDGIPATRTINLLCRCQCTPETCHWGTCGEYWYNNGTASTRDFCQCWTETQNMIFTLIYQTRDISSIEAYGALGYKVNNQAQLYYIGDDNAVVQVDYDDATVDIPNLFEKQLTQDFDGYTANYKITINEAKLSLTNGTPLYIRDTMSDTLAFVSGSLVITTEDANGRTATLEQGTDYTVTYDGTGNQTDETGAEVHVLDIVILHPQPVMYTLDYDTTLIFPEQVTGAIKYSNSAEITLWGESIKDTSAEKVYADINIAARNYKVKMFKTCAQTGEPLGGATFGLYNAQGGLITTEVTNENGELLFQTSVIEGIILREHIPYYMQELKAPPGYQLDNSKHWFCFCNKNEDHCAECDVILADYPNSSRIPIDQIGKVNVTNDIMYYDLPATGGPGVYPLILVSVILIIAPFVYGFILWRKRERRGVG